ncbi:MAG: hypothetical protein ABSE58_06175 [Candidatus Limnocylindrales bacterium]|jgi:hypothetical protein
MRPELHVFEGRGSGAVPRRPGDASAVNRLELAGSRLRRLEQILRLAGRPAEALAVDNIAALLTAEVSTGSDTRPRLRALP